ncbi:MAG: TOBE domain-containing protein [Dehalococcoidia bacterium]
MKISARNVLKGKVKSIKPGSVNDEVTMVLSGGDEIVAIITKTSSKNLKLVKNKKVYAIIKASSVMIGTD